MHDLQQTPTAALHRTDVPTTHRHISYARCWCCALLFSAGGYLLSAQSPVQSFRQTVPVTTSATTSSATDMTTASHHTGGTWHRVGASRRESLKHISRYYYGSSSHWRLLQVSNDVGRYVPSGTRIWIPALADAWFTHDQTAVTLLSQESDTYDHTSEHTHEQPSTSSTARPTHPHTAQGTATRP